MSEHDNLRKVLALMDELGLHGVIVASTKCPKCGDLHDFEAAATGIEQEAVPALLLLFSAHTAKEPLVSETPNKALHS